MHLLLPIFLWLCPSFAFTQGKGHSVTSKADTIKKNNRSVTQKPEILSSGFIDLISNGQVNASARFIRLYIGEPGRFAIPLSIYSGVSSNSFQNPQMPGGQLSNDQLVVNFINPLSGLANISADGILFFKPKPVKLTRSGFIYQAGIKILTGYRSGSVTDPATGKPINFLNSFGTAGLYFQTGAWEKQNTKNVGIFWFAFRYIACKSGSEQLAEILPSIQSNGFYHGWSLAWGVEINNLVNIKVLYYKYVKKPEIDYSLPIYQFSFNYSLR
jgi:hypothetical protein